MRRFVLDREARLETATFGTLYDLDQNFEIIIMELPWANNEPKISCIPEAIYVCKRDIHGKQSQKPYECWELTNVPNRSEIHIHIANFPIQIQGCLATGESYDVKIPRTFDSAIAFHKFMNHTRDLTEFELEIRNVDPDITEPKN